MHKALTVFKATAALTSTVRSCSRTESFSQITYSNLFDSAWEVGHPEFLSMDMPTENIRVSYYHQDFILHSNIPLKKNPKFKRVTCEVYGKNCSKFNLVFQFVTRTFSSSFLSNLQHSPVNYAIDIPVRLSIFNWYQWIDQSKTDVISIDPNNSYKNICSLGQLCTTLDKARHFSTTYLVPLLLTHYGIPRNP